MVLPKEDRGTPVVLPKVILSTGFCFVSVPVILSCQSLPPSMFLAGDFHIQAIATFCREFGHIPLIWEAGRRTAFVGPSLTPPCFPHAYPTSSPSFSPPLSSLLPPFRGWDATKRGLPCSVPALVLWFFGDLVLCMKPTSPPTPTSTDEELILPPHPTPFRPPLLCVAPQILLAGTG